MILPLRKGQTNRGSFKKGHKPVVGFMKGHKTWNKGVKQWKNGMPESMRQTQFKKGSKTLPNGRPFGSWLKKMPIVKTCVKCGKEFSVHPPARALRQKCCSYSCSVSNRHREVFLKSAAKTRLKNIQNGVYKRHGEYMKRGGAVKARLANFPPSRFQKEAFDEIKRLYPDATMEYTVHTIGGAKLVDIYIPSKGLIVECDGHYWHKDRQELDEIRQSKVEALGYRVVRIPEKKWKEDKNIFRYI